MKKIIGSVGVLALVSVLVWGATGAFFSDTETSTGNTFTAGAIDLQVKSQCSVSDSEVGTCGSWDYPTEGNGLTLGQFFNFDDVKPGDWGENTISFKVINNDAWMCANITSTNAENSITEPEAQLGDENDKGELGDVLSVMWWIDDGDNKYNPSNNDKILYGGPRTFNEWLALGGGSLPLTFADSYLNWKTWTGTYTTANTTPVPGNNDQHLGVAWCVGTITVTGDGNPGFTCDGSGVGNLSQTDSITADITFTAEQHRNQPEFRCPEHPINNYPVVVPS